MHENLFLVAFNFEYLIHYCNRSYGTEFSNKLKFCIPFIFETLMVKPLISQIKLKLFDLKELMIQNIKGQRHQIAKICTLYYIIVLYILI